jgi:hypothetical protein
LPEAGWPFHRVQEMLGQPSLDQTSTYLTVAHGRLRERMKKRDAIRSRCNSAARETDSSLTLFTTRAQRKAATLQ